MSRGAKNVGWSRANHPLAERIAATRTTGGNAGMTARERRPTTRRRGTFTRAGWGGARRIVVFDSSGSWRHWRRFEPRCGWSALHHPTMCRVVHQATHPLAERIAATRTTGGNAGMTARERRPTTRRRGTFTRARYRGARLLAVQTCSVPVHRPGPSGPPGPVRSAPPHGAAVGRRSGRSRLPDPSGSWRRWVRFEPRWGRSALHHPTGYGAPTAIMSMVIVRPSIPTPWTISLEAAGGRSGSYTSGRVRSTHRAASSSAT